MPFISSYLSSLSMLTFKPHSSFSSDGEDEDKDRSSAASLMTSHIFYLLYLVDILYSTSSFSIILFVRSVSVLLYLCIFPLALKESIAL
ncbi:hypothetical protein Csa_002468 [Cucumis sativus]|uniref:Uncharacterized protein n=1 Tax=Cucumis sativus TaxID=3659 RepID=A0A0A0LEF1_CUCSA|nr:hypothetical protein Csa_002468 [Cucumis sativus]